MNFFRMIKMDFKRMLLSGKFYFAIAGAMLVTSSTSGHVGPRHSLQIKSQG